MPRKRLPLNTTDAIQVVRLEALVILPELQTRVQLSPEALRDYTQIFQDVPEAQCTCPPITVYEHEGQLVLADGHHRVTAAQRAGRTTLKAYVRPSTADTLHDAWFYAMTFNMRHGEKYTTADKQKIIGWLVDHPRYRTCTTREIAALTGNLVVHGTVANFLNRREQAAAEALAKLNNVGPARPSGVVLSNLDKGSQARSTEDEDWVDEDDADEALPEGLDRMLDRFEHSEAARQEQYRRLRNVEGHMDLLMRRNDPTQFGAWLRHADVASPPGKSLQGLIDRDLLTYSGWLRRVHEAYMQTPPLSVFEEDEDGA